MNWAEQLGLLALVLGGVGIVGGIGVAVQKRRGTGSFAPPGPNPMVAKWVHGERAWWLFKNGAAMHFGLEGSAPAWKLGTALAMWEESVELGNLDALTALGILEHEDDRLDDAVRTWQRAADAGNVPAMMCLHSLRDESGVAYDQVSDAFLWAASHRANKLLEFADLADHYGAVNYADMLRRYAAPVDKPYWPGSR